MSCTFYECSIRFLSFPQCLYPMTVSQCLRVRRPSSIFAGLLLVVLSLTGVGCDWIGSSGNESQGSEEEPSLFSKTSAEFVAVNEGSSSVGDINEDGAPDLLVTGRAEDGEPATSLYLGDGNGGFVQTSAGLRDIYYSSSAIGDVNRDGHLDIVIVGQVGTTPVAHLYLGDGEGDFTEIDAGLEGVGNSSISIGDVNNDDNPDLLITGGTTTLYLGNGAGGFEAANAGLKEAGGGSSSAIGDVNGDGNPDLLVVGSNSDSTPSATLYLGNGDGGFTEAEVGLTGVEHSAATMRDVDEDDNLDILIAGSDSDVQTTTTLYLGDGNGGFQQADAGLTGVFEGSMSTGDVNGDGSLDLLITGADEDLRETATLYPGNGAGGFEKEDTDLVGVSNGMSSLADFDSDGDLDLFLAGDEGTDSKTAVLYENRTNE